MQAIIIGAGRGRRLKSMTDNQPKCYAPIGGQRILDRLLTALADSELGEHGRPVFIGGYLINMVREDYPQLTFCHNTDWKNNNILASLFHAEHHMEGGFICTYADIIFRPSVVRRAMEHEGDIVLCVDTHWRDRYAQRSQHSEEDAEKVMTDGDRVTRVDRTIAGEAAKGEYIGVAKFSPAGAAALREHYHRVRKKYTGQPWRGVAVFEKAYLIHLFQEMIEQQVAIHMVTTQGDYMEIDTEEDYALANRHWDQSL